MIQRIQSVWLLLAALVSSGLFYFSIYESSTVTNSVVVTETLKANNHFPILLITLVTIILPLVAIGMFKKRKQQLGLTMMSLLANISLVSVMLMRVGNINSRVPAPTDGSYMPGAVLPVVAMVFLILAIRGIRKDEKLVKSLDRLR